MKHLKLVGLLALAVATPLLAAPKAEEKSKTDASAGAVDVIASLVKQYNAHDAAKLSTLWKPEAVYVAKPSGAKTEGRKAIADAYAKLFKDEPEVEMSIRVHDVRLVTPTVATLDCTIDVRHAGGIVTRSEMTATVVQSDNSWLIDHVHETSAVLASPAAQGLSEFEWLIGKWQDTQGDIKVTNDFAWAYGHTFINRAYRQEKDGLVTRQGLQIIGWDAEQGVARCWLFDADGSFGEGVVDRESPTRWVIKMALKLSDGQRGSFTQIIDRDGADKFRVTSVSREIDGAAIPNSAPSTLVRSTSTETKSPKK